MEENTSKPQEPPVRIKGLKLAPSGEYIADMLFFSPVKEEKWLNRAAKDGFALAGRRLKGYVFIRDENASLYHYSVHSLENPPESPISKAYIEKRGEESGEFICAFINTAYFKTRLRCFYRVSGQKCPRCLKQINDKIKYELNISYMI